MLTEVEGVLNSRLLIYGDKELGEILTPSHLKNGKRMLDRQSQLWI